MIVVGCHHADSRRSTIAVRRGHTTRHAERSRYPGAALVTPIEPSTSLRFGITLPTAVASSLLVSSASGRRCPANRQTGLPYQTQALGWHGQRDGARGSVTLRST